MRGSVSFGRFNVHIVPYTSGSYTRCELMTRWSRVRYLDQENVETDLKLHPTTIRHTLRPLRRDWLAIWAIDEDNKAVCQ
ncbi:hypothetical protein TNCV_1925291 [Trichonephila clavipes]|nr:hypothetical protein TNCV_1925291 [Trichonephila clavipes]